MLNLTLKYIESMTNGKLNNEDFSDIIIDEVSIDTRTLEKDELYVPIIGENFDGHIFIEKAIDKGAAAILSNYNSYENNDFPVIYVEDTTKAMQDLSSNYRSRVNPKIIAITGSNGKTSTKDMLASVLSHKFKTKKTIGNLNNHIGLPKTLLTFDNDTEVGIVEMGTDGFGQIELLSNIAKPDIAIITNIGDSHLEQLKTKENIAKEKLHILDGLSKNGIFIYNLDDPILSSEYEKNKEDRITITIGKHPEADYNIEIIETNNNGTAFKVNKDVFNLNLIGEHQVYNATMAISVSDILDVDRSTLREALMKNQSTEMRTELLNFEGFDVLNDSYKSNPQSLLSAISTLKILHGYSQKIAILGDMLELGETEKELHSEIGKQIKSSDVDYLLLYGPLSKNIAEEAEKNFPEGRVFYFESKDRLVDKAKTLISKGSIVLVKASRSMHLEEIIESISKINL